MKRILTAIAVLLMACATVFAQGGYQVKGVVVDAMGPVIGAAVVQQGTTNGTSTGVDGDYTLTVPSGDAIIEIIDIENMENGTSQWTGDEDDPVFDPNDEEVMKNPEAAAKKAWDKWRTMKVNLRKKLKEVDAAAVALRDQWTQYQRDVAAFESIRVISASSGRISSCDKVPKKSTKSPKTTGSEVRIRPSVCNPIMDNASWATASFCRMFRCSNIL